MPETIGKVVLCYDVSTRHNEVKDALKQLGYLDRWEKMTTKTIYDLPDTTLWHETKQVSEATKDIQKVCATLNVTLKRSFSVLIANEADGYNEPRPF